MLYPNMLISRIALWDDYMWWGDEVDVVNVKSHEIESWNHHLEKHSVFEYATSDSET